MSVTHLNMERHVILYHDEHFRLERVDRDTVKTLRKH